MSDTISVKLSIPSDDDGFILLRCSYCGAFFKITVSDLKDDSILDINCPSCGLISNCYYTDDVIELAQAKITNIALDIMYDKFKQLERKNKSKSMIQIKAGQRPKHQHENPLYSRIDELTIKHFACCNRDAKINPLNKMSASFCPFCGVICFEDEQNGIENNNERI